MEIRGECCRKGNSKHMKLKTLDFTDRFRGSWTTKAHPQILLWISGEEYLIVANPLGLEERGLGLGRLAQGHTENRPQNQSLLTPPPPTPHPHPCRNPLCSITRK